MKTKLKNENMPVYLGVYNSLYSDIIEGVYKPNEHLPGETALSEKYGVSRNTLRQALAILSEDGMIIKSQGKGTIVAPKTVKPMEEQITNPLLSLSKLTVNSTDLSYNYGAPTDIARDKLHLAASDIVLACYCVYKSDDRVLGYSFTQVPAAFFDEFGLDASKEDSIKELILNTLFQYSESMNMTVKLIYANEIEMEFLEVPAQTPLLLIEAIHYNKTKQPFSRNKFYFIPEYYHINFVLNN